jgi:EmrB/QacA subfamily drug resistance transporter
VLSGTTQTARRRRVALGLLAITQFMLIADQTVVNIALPSIGAELGVTGVGLSWVVNAYVLTFGGLLLLAGRATDLFGRRRLFITGMTLFAVSSLAGGFSGSQAMLISARAAQGVGAAILASSGLATMIGMFPEGQDRNRALGIWAAAAASGGSIGLLLGGLLTNGPGWEWVFWVNVPIGLIGALAAPVLLTEARAPRPRRLDVAGSVTVTAGVSLLVFAFTQAEHAGWVSTQTFATLAAAIGLLASFVAIERRAADPLLAFGIFRSRAVSAANTAMVLFAAGIYAAMFFLSLYLQEVLGYTPLEAGLAYLPLALPALILGPVGGRLLTAVGTRTTTITGSVLALVGMVWFTQISADGSFWVNVLGPSVLIAAGGQFAVVGMTSSAIGGVSESEQGIASGVFNTSREIGGAFGVGVLAAVAATQAGSLTDGAAAGAQALNDGFQAGLTGGAAFVFIAVLLTVVLLPRDPPGTRPARVQSEQPLQLRRVDRTAAGDGLGSAGECG